jgi:hypothetical protein
MIIKAICEDHALLKAGAIPIIGDTISDKNYTQVCFHYATEYSDFFLFGANGLIFHSVYEGRKSYLMEIYIACAKYKDMTAERFVDIVVMFYVLTEMGFIDEAADTRMPIFFSGSVEDP